MRKLPKIITQEETVIKLANWIRKNKYNLLYGVVFIISITYIPITLDLLTSTLQSFSRILSEATAEGMSPEFKLIFIFGKFWILSKFISMFAHWLHTCIEEIRLKEKK